jgi:hypothetical protein
MLENARYEFRSRSGTLLEPSRGRGDRLESWKEVALFFRRGVRTVQLWEKSEGLPIRRHHHNRLATVYAHRPELEAWWQARGIQIENRSEVDPGKTQPVSPRGTAICASPFILFRGLVRDLT